MLEWIIFGIAIWLGIGFLARCVLKHRDEIVVGEKWTWKEELLTDIVFIPGGLFGLLFYLFPHLAGYYGIGLKL